MPAPRHTHRSLATAPGRDPASNDSADSPPSPPSEPDDEFDELDEADDGSDRAPAPALASAAVDTALLADYDAEGMDDKTEGLERETPGGVAPPYGFVNHADAVWERSRGEEYVPRGEFLGDEARTAGREGFGRRQKLETDLGEDLGLELR